MFDLTWLFPVPEPVRAGGETYMAVCLQVRDIAALQAFVKARAGNPLAAARAALLAGRESCGGDYLAETPEGSGYATLVRATWDALETRSPGPFGDVGRVFETDAGAAFFLVVFLSRTNPGFGEDQAHSLLGRLGRPEHVHEFADLLDVAFDRHPIDALSELMDPGSGRRPRQVDWLEELTKLPEETGWTYQQIGDLFLSQLKAHSRRGKLRAATDVGPAIGKRRAELWRRGFSPPSNGMAHTPKEVLSDGDHDL